MYNYKESIKEAIINYVRDDIDTTEFTDREDLEMYLEDALFTVDSVTGNASGSYTFCTQTAKEYVMDNFDLLFEMVNEYGYDAQSVGEWFINGEWEAMDVRIRCYLLYPSIVEALDEIEDELKFTE